MALASTFNWQRCQFKAKPPGRARRAVEPRPLFTITGITAARWPCHWASVSGEGLDLGVGDWLRSAPPSTFNWQLFQLRVRRERGGRLGLPGKAGQRQTDDARRGIEAQTRCGLERMVRESALQDGPQMCLNSFNMRPISGTNAKKSAVTESPVLMDEYPRISALTRLATAEAERHKEQPAKAKVRQSKSSKEKPSPPRANTAPSEGRLAARASTETPRGLRSIACSNCFIPPPNDCSVHRSFIYCGGSIQQATPLLGAAVPWRLNRSARYT